MKFLPNSLRLRAIVYVSVYAFALGACKDGTEPLVPSAVQIAAGDQQTASVGAAVPIAPSVRVMSSSGKPVPNVRVTFTAGAESGVVVGGAQVTNASGVATVTSWTLGTKAGSSTLTATAEGVAPVTFTATTQAGTPANVTVVGSGQNGLVATALTNAPGIVVVDAHGNLVANVPVTFAVQSGTLEVTSTQTNQAGVASAGRWTLGNRSGPQSVTATAGSLAPVAISAMATADVATQMVITRQPSTQNASGDRLSVQPIVEFRDRFDNLATGTSLPVTASVAAGDGVLGGGSVVNAQGGRATFTDLVFTGTGAVQLRFAAPGFQAANSASFTVLSTSPCAGPNLTLDFAVGQMERFVTSTPASPRCLDFSVARNADQEYLVMFENLAGRGSGNALFPGVANEKDGSFDVSVRTRTTSGAVVSAPVFANARRQEVPMNAVHGWDFGDQTVYEVQPKTPPGGAMSAKVQRAGGLVDANSVSAAIAVGDTIQVFLESIRASIPAGTYKAIVRLVTPDIVIAEDLRIFSRDSSFTRANSTPGAPLYNTPMTDADLQEIADQYAQNARVQGDRLFGNRHNSSTTQHPGRPIAVHSLMFASNVWGYTYSTTNYFVWDYWVGTDGSTKSVAQHAQRNADDLFMHEIAHMRHMGLMERAGLGASQRGHTWVTEGFARYTERLPIAARLLGNVNPSRTGNVTLPFNPEFRNAQGQQTYFFDDVPTYLQTTSSMYGGYGSSAYLFDYFADQVALAGGDWWTAVPDLLINLGAENTANAAVAKHLPGLDFATLFTRARIALYLDDYAPGLPAWTQYHMYNLRASRPPGNNSGLDPRNQFPRIKVTEAFVDARSVAAGGAFGYLIDGAGATSDVRVDFEPAAVTNGVMTVVRIK